MPRTLLNTQVQSLRPYGIRYAYAITECTFGLQEPTLYQLSYVREAAILANRALGQRVASTRSSDARIEASRPGRSTVSAAAPVVSIALTAERIATRSRSRSSIAARA